MQAVTVTANRELECREASRRAVFSLSLGVAADYVGKKETVYRSLYSAPKGWPLV